MSEYTIITGRANFAHGGMDDPADDLLIEALARHARAHVIRQRIFVAMVYIGCAVAMIGSAVALIGH